MFESSPKSQPDPEKQSDPLTASGSVNVSPDYQSVLCSAGVVLATATGLRLIDDGIQGAKDRGSRGVAGDLRKEGATQAPTFEAWSSAKGLLNKIQSACVRGATQTFSIEELAFLGEAARLVRDNQHGSTLKDRDWLGSATDRVFNSAETFEARYSSAVDDISMRELRDLFSLLSVNLGQRFVHGVCSGVMRSLPDMLEQQKDRLALLERGRELVSAQLGDAKRVEGVAGILGGELPETFRELVSWLKSHAPEKHNTPSPEMTEILVDLKFMGLRVIENPGVDRILPSITNVGDRDLVNIERFGAELL
jgi:hypothetical protein